MLYRIKVMNEIYVEADTFEEAEAEAKMHVNSEAHYAECEAYEATLDGLDPLWACSCPWGKTLHKTCKELLEERKEKC